VPKDIGAPRQALLQELGGSSRDTDEVWLVDGEVRKMERTRRSGDANQLDQMAKSCETIVWVVRKRR
jgi:hypothetical protein